MTDTPIDPAAFRHTLGHYPTGVAAITTLDADGAPVVLVVGTFSSVSLDPPLVGFLPDKKSYSWQLIAKTGKFAVNVLGSDQVALCGQLAGKGDKFAGVAYSTTDKGVPLLDGVIATIECTVAGVLDAGDHDFVLGRVQSLAVLREGDPMVFYKGKYGGFGTLVD